MIHIKSQEDYRDPIIERVIEALDEGGPSVLQGHYMNGAPEDYQQVELPLCYVYRDNTDDGPVTTSEDEIAHRLKAVVVYDRTQDLAQAYDMITGNSSLAMLVEKYDPQTLMLQRDCLLYQVRRGLTIGPDTWMGIKSRTTISYGVGVDKGNSDNFSVQATIGFMVYQHQLSPFVIENGQ